MGSRPHVDRVVAHVLAARQRHIARRFACSSGDRFADLAWRPGPHALPLITGAVARLVCRRYAILPGGDYLIVIGAVEEHQATSGVPLMFLDGQFTSAP